MKVRPQLSVYGRWLLMQRVMSGSGGACRRQAGVSRATGYKSWRQWREEGAAGLQGQSSHPQRT